MKKRVQEVGTQPQQVQPTNIQSIQPVPEKRPPGFALGRIENFLRDPAIQSIECPGPGKNVMVRKYNKINMTKLALTQEEVSELINKFSKEARIPVMGGILKAAVGDLVISAVISDLVGSRFIINRITPYSMLVR